MRTRNLEIPGSRYACPGMTGELPQPPADLLDKALVELGVIGALRRLPHELIEAVGIVADQDAPVLGLNAVENDLGCGRRCGRRLVAKTAGAIECDLLNVLIRHRPGVDAHALQTLARREHFVVTQTFGFTAALDLAGV